MIITLIGMSGAGKTHWAKQLEREGFIRVGVDDIIEAKLDQELVGLGYSGIADVAKWMGLPFEAKYERTSQLYMDFERDAILEVLMLAYSQSESGSDIVIDTPGSLIYVPDDILRELAQRTTLVYFHTPESAHAELAKRYLTDPKPIIWGESYKKKGKETAQEALIRCYPLLLQDRTVKYQRIAHTTFNFAQLSSKEFTATDIIDYAAAAAK
jgi:hypothetical protein